MDGPGKFLDVDATKTERRDREGKIGISRLAGRWCEGVGVLGTRTGSVFLSTCTTTYLLHATITSPRGLQLQVCMVPGIAVTQPRHAFASPESLTPCR